MTMGSNYRFIPPSLSGLNLPINPFNVMTTISASIREARLPHVKIAPSPFQADSNKVIDISMPSMLFTCISAWRHPQTLRPSILTNLDESRFLRALPPPRHLIDDIRQKRKLSIGMSIPQGGGGRSRAAQPAVKTYQHKRYPNAQNKFKIILF